jgi:hypothetical protein
MSFWDNFLEEMRSLGETLLEWAILIIIALVILVIGRWILKWVRTLIEKVLDLPWLDKLWDSSGVTRALEPSDQTPPKIIATIAYAYLMVVLWLIVVRVLKLETIEVLLLRVLAWIPIVILAGVVILIAAAVANWVANLVRPFAADKGIPWLTWVVKIAIILFGVLFAMDLLQVTFAEDLTKIITFALGAAFAISFGIGGIDTAKLWWRKYATPSAVESNTGGGVTPPPASGGYDN